MHAIWKYFRKITLSRSILSNDVNPVISPHWITGAIITALAILLNISISPSKFINLGHFASNRPLTWMCNGHVPAAGTVHKRRHSNCTNVDIPMVFITHHHVHEQAIGWTGTTRREGAIFRGENSCIHPSILCSSSEVTTLNDSSAPPSQPGDFPCSIWGFQGFHQQLFTWKVCAPPLSYDPFP